ncbi:MAG: DUF6056 family protein [Chitinophagales bacterium]
MPPIVQHKKLLLFLLLAAWLPYLYICFYAFPFADDFCFGWTALENISFTRKFLNQYLGWNGRYSADVLANLHPLSWGSVKSYQLSLFVSLVLTPAVIYLLVREIIVNRERIDSLIAALFITLFYLNYQPDITEGMYWYIGIVNYHWGILSLVLQLTLLLKSHSKQGLVKLLLQVASLFLLWVTVGFNETGALLIPIFYAAALLYSYGQPAGKRYLWWLHLIVAATGAAAVFFSPGNFERAVLFPERYRFFHSLLFAALQTVRFTGLWIFTLPFAVLSLLLVVYRPLIEWRLPGPLNYKLLLAALFGVVFTGSFLPYFATGLLGQHRTIDFVFFFFILLWIVFVFTVSNHLNLAEKRRTALQAQTRPLLLLSVAALVLTGNSWRILTDIHQHNFARYQTAFVQREQAIIKNPKAPIPKLTGIPNTFHIADVKNDTAYWIDKCMSRYYTARAEKP